MITETADTSDVERRVEGTIFKKLIGSYTVRYDGRDITCSISSRLRKELIYPNADPGSRRHRVDAVQDIRTIDPVAIGDRVAFLDGEDGTGVIKEVLPRKNRLSRCRAGPKPREQVIVANVDRIVLVFAAAKPKLKWNLVDRYLAGAEACHIAPLICITKMDLADEEALNEEARIYEEIAYPVVRVCAPDGRGVDEMRDCLKDRMSVFVGVSGAGKTTLLNALQPDLGLRVNEIGNVTGKGKHTTTHLEMFPLDFGGAIVDTPGVREFGLWNVKRMDIPGLFPEMRPYLGQCKFRSDCSHRHEPGCAIKKAVEMGAISYRRYQSCLKM